MEEDHPQEKKMGHWEKPCLSPELGWGRSFLSLVMAAASAWTSGGGEAGERSSCLIMRIMDYWLDPQGLISLLSYRT